MNGVRKRMLAIVAGIIVARHLKTTEDLFDNRPSPRTESLVAAAVQLCEKMGATKYGRWRCSLPALGTL